MKTIFIRVICVISVSMILTGCSLSLAYKYADWWLAWKADDYVSLNDDQKQHLDTLFQQFLIWHKQNELPKYAQHLTRLQQIVENKNIEQFNRWFDDSSQLWQPAIIKMLDSAHSLLNTLSIEQRQELIKNIANQQQERHEKWLETENENQRLEEEVEELEEMVGELSSSQLTSFKQYIEQVPRALELRIESRKKWLVLFSKQLESTEISKRELIILLTDPTSYRSAALIELFDKRKSAAKRWYGEALLTLSQTQQKHLIEKVNDYLEDINEIILSEQ